jgi:hypothetical protein
VPAFFFTTPMKYDITSKQACELLHISESTLRRMRKAGYFRPGTHFIATGMGQKAPSLLWCAALLEEALAKRTRRVMSP